MLFNSSPSKGLSSVCESNQCESTRLGLGLDDDEQPGQGEEQLEEEGSTEENLPWVAASGEAVCELSQLVLDLDDEEQQEEEGSTEEELPWVPVHCDAECESGDGSELSEAPVTPHPLLGVPGVLSGQAPCLPGPITPDLRVRPPQIWGLADEELEPWPSLFWLCSCSPSYTGPCCSMGAQPS